jgi:hypothetical protein
MARPIETGTVKVTTLAKQRLAHNKQIKANILIEKLTLNKKEI